MTQRRMADAASAPDADADSGVHPQSHSLVPALFFPRFGFGPMLRLECRSPASLSSSPAISARIWPTLPFLRPHRPKQSAEDICRGTHLCRTTHFLRVHNHMYPRFITVLSVESTPCAVGGTRQSVSMHSNGRSIRSIITLRSSSLSMPNPRLNLPKHR